MAALPDRITAVAYLASNGELAWRRSDIATALFAIAESGQATLGGEVWVAMGNGQWVGMIPDAAGGPPGVWHWDTAPQAAGENWPAYCRRAAAESARVLAAMRVEEESHPAVRDRLYFNITYVSQAEAHQA